MKQKIFLGLRIAVCIIIAFAIILSVLTYITTPYIKPDEPVLSYESLVLDNTQTENELEIFESVSEPNRSETLKNVCNVMRKNTYQYISKPKGILLTLRMEGAKNYIATVITELFVIDTRIYDIYKYKDEYYILNFRHDVDTNFLNSTGTRMAVYKVVDTKSFREIENYKKDMFLIRHYPFWLWSLK